jgi:glyoxylase-like metal-dependent hydrolase (beta-lactamase superfamily II)
MTTVKIGNTTVTRIQEIMGPGFPAATMLPDWDPAILEEHGNWMIPNYYEPSSGKFISSIHSWLIRTPHHVILVDTCCGNGKDRTGSDRFHMLDTPYLQRLADAGVQPEDVDYVLCTHLHVDHVGWNTRLLDGRWVPTFPNAKYVFSRTERDHWDPALNPNLPAMAQAVFTDSVLPVIAARQDHLVEMTDSIGDGLLIEPAPGHAPGHIVLRLQDGGDEGIFIGDVMHHPIQVYRPEWSSCFCPDPAMARTSRLRVLEQSAENGCLVLPAHFGIPHIGRVKRHGSGFRFAFGEGT